MLSSLKLKMIWRAGGRAWGVDEESTVRRKKNQKKLTHTHVHRTPDQYQRKIRIDEGGNNLMNGARITYDKKMI